MSETYEAVERERSKLRNELAATKQKLEAAQLHTKELREALQWYVNEDETNEGGEWEDSNKYWLDSKRKAESLLAKQPDTRALDKALLEAEIDTIEIEFDYYIAGAKFALVTKLAELNKE